MLEITHYHMQEADVITKVERDEKKKDSKKRLDTIIVQYLLALQFHFCNDRQGQTFRPFDKNRPFYLLPQTGVCRVLCKYQGYQKYFVYRY